MTTVATKFQVTLAAAAVAGAAAFAPVAANAAPAIQLPAAPVHFADVPLGPKGPVYIITATSIQVLSVFLKQSAASQDRRADRLEAYAAAHPDSVFGNLAAARAAQLRKNQAVTNGIQFDICLNGNSVGIAPYGSVSTGTC